MTKTKWYFTQKSSLVSLHQCRFLRGWSLFRLYGSNWIRSEDLRVLNWIFCVELLRFCCSVTISVCSNQRNVCLLQHFGVRVSQSSDRQFHYGFKLFPLLCDTYLCSYMLVISCLCISLITWIHWMYASFIIRFSFFGGRCSCLRRGPVPHLSKPLKIFLLKSLRSNMRPPPQQKTSAWLCVWLWMGHVTA